VVVINSTPALPASGFAAIDSFRAFYFSESSWFYAWSVTGGLQAGEFLMKHRTPYVQNFAWQSALSRFLTFAH
jgi:hypothetical protein